MTFGSLRKVLLIKKVLERVWKKSYNFILINKLLLISLSFSFLFLMENLGYSTQCKTTRYCVVLVEMRLQLQDQEKVLKPVLQDTACKHNLG